MARLPLAWLAGIVTLGLAPNAPVTVTGVFVPDPPDGEEVDEDVPDEPQPASSRMPSAGTVRAAAMRRMRKPQNRGGLSVGQPTRWPEVPEQVAVRSYR